MVTMLFAACTSEYDVRTDPGPNGEPGPDLGRVYSKKFLVARSKYFEVLDTFYSFAIDHSFNTINAGACFQEVLDEQVMSLDRPCIAMWAATGAPTKAHLMLVVEHKQIHRLDEKDHFEYRVEAFTFTGYEPFNRFGETIEQEMQKPLHYLSDAIRQDIGVEAARQP